MENIESVQHLNYWLVQHLEPICDADPIVLAKYVIALLQKDKPEKALRQICLKQLEIFLGNETNLFVDMLFDVLRSREYMNSDGVLPVASTPPPPPGAQDGAAGSSAQPGASSAALAVPEAATAGQEADLPPQVGTSSGETSAPELSSRKMASRIFNPQDFGDSGSSASGLEVPTSSAEYSSNVLADNIVADSSASRFSHPRSVVSSTGQSEPYQPTESINTSGHRQIAPISFSIGSKHLPSTTTSSSDSSVPPSAALMDVDHRIQYQQNNMNPYFSTLTPEPFGTFGTVRPSTTTTQSRPSSNQQPQNRSTSGGRRASSSRHQQRSRSRSGSYCSTCSSSGRSRSSSTSDDDSESSSSSEPSQSRTGRGKYASSRGQDSDRHRSSRTHNRDRTSPTTSAPVSAKTAQAASSSGLRNAGPISSTSRGQSGRDANHRSRREPSPSRNRRPAGGGSRGGNDHHPVSSHHQKGSYRLGSASPPTSSRSHHHSTSSGHYRGSKADSGRSGYDNSHRRGGGERSDRSGGRSANRYQDSTNQPSSSSRGYSKDGGRKIAPSSSTTASSAIDYQALAAQYAMALQAANALNSGNVDSNSLLQPSGNLTPLGGGTPPPELATMPATSTESASTWDRAAASSSADQEPREGSEAKPLDGTEDGALAPGGALAHDCPDMKEKGFCEKGLYCLFAKQAAAAQASSSQSAQATPQQYFLEPYNPESATSVDPTLLMHILPGFMQQSQHQSHNPYQSQSNFAPFLMQGNTGDQEDQKDSVVGEGQAPLLAPGSYQSLKMLQKLNQNLLLHQNQLQVMNTGGSGSGSSQSSGAYRQRELLGVNLAGGEPYVPKALRPSSGSKRGYVPNYRNNQQGGQNQCGRVKRSNVIDVMSQDAAGGTGKAHKQYTLKPMEPSESNVLGEEGSPQATGGSGEEAPDVPKYQSSPSVIQQQQSQMAKPGPSPITNDKTWLLLRKVPPKLNTIGSLDKHFSRYGTVVNIQVCYENDPESALVQFSNSFEATAAIRSTDAVMGNRFIKIYWAHSHHAQQSSTQPGAVKHGGGGYQPKPKPNQLQSKPYLQKPWQQQNKLHFKQQQPFNPFPNQLQSSTYHAAQAATGGVEESEKTEFSSKFAPKTEQLEEQTVDQPQAAAPGPPAAPPIKTISRVERSQKLKELADLSKALQDAMANQKLLMAKMASAKTAKEKQAILKLIEVTIGDIKAMKDKCEVIQNVIKPSLQTTKVNNRLVRVPAVLQPPVSSSGPVSLQDTSIYRSRRRRLSQDTSTTNGDEDDEEEEVVDSTKRNRLSPPATISSSNNGSENDLIKYAAKYEEELQRMEREEKESSSSSSGGHDASSTSLDTAQNGQQLALEQPTDSLTQPVAIEGQDGGE